jgi:O-antigen/teichoic acid export membrane protein
VTIFNRAWDIVKLAKAGPRAAGNTSLSIKQRATIGSFWTIASYGGSQVLRLVSNVILARLLVPQAFGLMALVNTFLQFLELLSDFGIRPTIVQHKRGDDPDFLNTAWTLSIVRGSGLWVVICLIAYPLARFYDQPDLLWLIPVAGLASFLNAFQSTASHTLSRHMQLGVLSIMKIGTQFIGVVITVIWAWISPTVWSLVIGSVVAAFLNMILTHTLLPGPRSRLHWDKEAGRALFDFGRWIFISTMIGCFAQQSDRLILGKLITPEVLGVYWIAYNISDVPRQLLNQVGTTVLFPAVSRLAHLPREELRRKLTHQLGLRLGIAGIVLAAVTVVSDGVIDLLYDDRYIQAVWMAPVFAIGIWPRIMTTALGPALLGVGEPKYTTWSSTARLIFVLVALPLAYIYFGLFGAVLVVSFADVPRYLVLCMGLHKEGLFALKADVVGTLIFLGTLGLLILIRYMIGFGTPFDMLPIDAARAAGV